MRSMNGNALLPTPHYSIEDLDLENRIANFLYQRQVPRSENIRTNAHLGTVVVRGELPTRHAKWLCIECCRHVAGVIKLIDHVVVKPAVRPKRVEAILIKWNRKKSAPFRRAGIDSRLLSGSTC
jgi:hypothetical protein